MDKKIELKPCPFCGAEAVVREMVHEGLWVVECSNPKQDDHYAQSYGNTREAGAAKEPVAVNDVLGRIS